MSHVKRQDTRAKAGRVGPDVWFEKGGSDVSRVLEKGAAGPSSPTSDTRGHTGLPGVPSAWSTLLTPVGLALATPESPLSLPPGSLP